MERDYICAITSSPRRNGNTETLLKEAVRGAQTEGIEVVEIAIADLRLNPCRACNGCFTNGECVQRDEMQDIYPHLTGAAGIMFAAPIFSMNLNAQAKAMIDRCQRFWAIKYVLEQNVVDPEFRARRHGLFISVCGRDDPRIFDCTVPTISYFFHVIEVKSWEKLTYHNVDPKGAILEHATALGDAFAAGGRMAEALLSKK